MKKSLFFLIFMLSLQGASAQRMRDVFSSMPDSVLEVMTKNNRLDCIDFIENNMEARVRNRFDGFSELNTLTEDYLNLNLTSSCLVEMKLLPVADSISYICVVKTYSGPVRESEVTVYTDKWKLLPREKWIKWPEYNDFWQANDSITDVDIRSILEADSKGYGSDDRSSFGEHGFSQQEFEGDELVDVEDAYREVTGEGMTKFYRPPQGKYSESNLQMAQELGYKTFFWSLAYVDWYDDNQPTKEEAFDKLLGRIHPGAIVLLHSTSDTNSLILDELIQKWEEMGYTIRPLTELS